MIFTLLNNSRNLLFDLYPEQFVRVAASFRVMNIYEKHLTQNSIIQNAEELAILAEQEAETYSRPIFRRLLLIAPQAHIKNTYLTHFVKYYKLISKQQ